VIEAVAVEAVGSGQSASDEAPTFAPRASALAPIRINRIFTDGAHCEAAVSDRDHVRPGDAIDGPAIVCERNATTVIEPGWRATLTPRDHVVLERVEAHRA